jgi:hypothetical protein
MRRLSGDVPHRGAGENFKRKPPAWTVEREVERGSQGKLVQRDEDGKEDILNGQVLQTICNFGHAMAAAGRERLR